MTPKPMFFLYTVLPACLLRVCEIKRGEASEGGGIWAHILIRRRLATRTCLSSHPGCWQETPFLGLRGGDVDSPEQPLRDGSLHALFSGGSTPSTLVSQAGPALRPALLPHFPSPPSASPSFPQAASACCFSPDSVWNWEK